MLNLPTQANATVTAGLMCPPLVRNDAMMPSMAPMPDIMAIDSGFGVNLVGASMYVPIT